MENAWFQPMPSTGPAENARRYRGGSTTAYTATWSATKYSITATTAAPASVPPNAGQSAVRVPVALVPITVMVASSAQRPWPRSSAPTISRAADRASAIRTAFWKYTDRGVRWVCRRRA